MILSAEIFRLSVRVIEGASRGEIGKTIAIM